MPREDWIENTIEKIFGDLYPAGPINTVLDVGCGLSFKSQYIKAAIRIGLDVYRPYLEKVDASCPHVLINSPAADIDKLFLPKSFDIVLLLDVVEHIEKVEALVLIAKAEALARRAVVIETPSGYLPQNIDILGLGGDDFQTHRCGFEAEELKDLGYRIILRDYTLSDAKRHTTDVSPRTITMIDAIKRLD